MEGRFGSLSEASSTFKDVFYRPPHNTAKACYINHHIFTTCMCKWYPLTNRWPWYSNCLSRAWSMPMYLFAGLLNRTLDCNWVENKVSSAPCGVCWRYGLCLSCLTRGLTVKEFWQRCFYLLIWIARHWKIQFRRWRKACYILSPSLGRKHFQINLPFFF